MSNTSWRRIVTPFVVAIICATGLGAATAIAPPRAAAYTCTVVSPCYLFTMVLDGTGDLHVSTNVGGINCYLIGTISSGTCTTKFPPGGRRRHRRLRRRALLLRAGRRPGA